MEQCLTHSLTDSSKIQMLSQLKHIAEYFGQNLFVAISSDLQTICMHKIYSQYIAHQVHNIELTVSPREVSPHLFPDMIHLKSEWDIKYSFLTSILSSISTSVGIFCKQMSCVFDGNYTTQSPVTGVTQSQNFV